MEKKKVLMVGPSRDSKGGISSVVNSYFESGLDNIVELKYIESTNDKKYFGKWTKWINGYVEYLKCVKKYEIVHIHMSYKGSIYRQGIYAKIAKKCNKEVIFHLHGSEFKKYYNKCSDKKKRRIKKILNLADKLIVLSEEWKKFYSKLYKNAEDVIVIYNSVKIPKDFNKDIDNKQLLFLGRLGQRKGIYDLLDAMANIVIEDNQVKLYIGGDGENNKVNKIIKEKGLEKNVFDLGWINGVKKEELLKSSSIFILPSYNEGMPMSVLEAMAYKNIVITTNVGGIPEIIKNNENGIIVNPGDTEELYNAIKKVLNYNEFKKITLSVNGRKTIEKNFDINMNILKLLNTYRS